MQKESEIRTMNFHPADPMIILYNPIKKLRKLAELADIAHTKAQLLDISLTTLKLQSDRLTSVPDSVLMIRTNLTSLS